MFGTQVHIQYMDGPKHMQLYVVQIIKSMKNIYILYMVFSQ